MADSTSSTETELRTLPRPFPIYSFTSLISVVIIGTPQENAATIRGVFDGSIRDARRNAVLLNAAGAMIIGDKAADFPEGIKLVAELIDSGAAEAKLAELVEMSNQYV